LKDLPIISDLISPPSYLTYDWVAIRLMAIGGSGVLLSWIIKSIWSIYQQRKNRNTDIRITADDVPTLLILLSGLSIILGLFNPIFVVIAVLQIVIATKPYKCSHTE